MNKNGVKIIKVESKDIKNGLVITGSKKKYKATLDYSLLGIKLEETGANYYDIKGKQYTDDIINVTYNYSLDNGTRNYSEEDYNRIDKLDVEIGQCKDKTKIKELRKAKKDILDKYKNKKSNELKLLEDEINSKTTKEIEEIKAKNKQIQKDSLVGIKDKEEKQAIREEIKEKNKEEIKIVKHENGILYRELLQQYKMSTSQLREDNYKNGFDVTFKETGEVVHYVRFLRSSGSGRQGKCLFIREELYNPIMEWVFCGLDIQEGADIDLASLEAYISLVSSSIVNVISGIKKENILVIDETTDTFTDKVYKTGVDGDDRLYTEECDMSITNSIHDGQALMDASIYSDNGYEEKGMLLLRNRFFKGACFNTNIQKWFTDNNITNIEQLNGYTMATDIKDIKLILNKTCIKYVKFGTIEQWLDLLEDNWGVVKYEKPTHHFGGRLVNTHYQLLNTLNFNREEMLELLQPSMDYLDLLLNNPKIMRNHLKMKQKADEDVDIANINKTDEMIMTMISLTDKFAETKLYSDFRGDIKESFIRELQKGHVLINGTYSVLFGNPIEMLKVATGDYKEGESISIFNKGEVYCKGFKQGELLGCRSPHVTMGNLAYLSNVRIPAIDTYFNLSRNIICVNSIGENTLERLSSADFDSDQLLLTDNKLMIDKLKLHYNKFLVPTSDISAKKVKRTYTASQKSDLDIKTSVNKIGDIINTSQQLNSILWDKYNNYGVLDMDLYKDICQLDVMSCIEIDKAKKEFAVNNIKELQELRKKYKLDSEEEDKTQVKAYFLQFMGNIKEEDKEKSYAKIEFKKMNTSMDYLEDIIEKEFKKIKAKKNKNDITIFDLLSKDKTIKTSGSQKKIRDSILDLCYNTKKETSAVWSRKGNNLSKEELKEFNTQKFIDANDIKENCIRELANKKIEAKDIKKLLKDLSVETREIKELRNKRKKDKTIEINMDKYKVFKIARLLVTVLFASHKEEFLELFKEINDADYLRFSRKNDNIEELETIKLYNTIFVVEKKKESKNNIEVA